jgi:anaerobic magnesium-protoporphyrin IX monomethyl ester cyclase
MAELSTGPGHLSSPRADPHLRACLLTLYLHESLGARQLCSVLRARGHACRLIFLKKFRWGEFRLVTPREEDILLSLLRDLSPGLLGISITSSLTADLAFALADRIRRQFDIPIILGGAHPSVCPEQSLEHADFVCRGEGEQALAELADALAAGRPADAIANVWTRANGEIKRNDVRPLADDLDSLPFVTFGEPGCYFIEDGYLQEDDPATHIPLYHTNASRMACPFSCAFCAGVWLRRELYEGKGQVRRYRSVDRIVAEIKLARQRHPGMQVVQFWDEVFTVHAPPGWLDEFCERFPKEVGLPFGIWSHPGIITEEQVAKLRAAGLRSVTLGVESGCEQVRREVLNRHERNSTVLRAAAALHKHGVEAGYDFILDLPWLDEENCRGTFELVMQLPQPLNLGLHSLSFLPETGVTRRALAEGLLRPEQVAGADRSLPERFEAFLWKHRLGAGNRRAAYWHSLIYLASMSFIPRQALWMAYRLRALLQLYPQPLIVLAEAARTKKETGQAKLFQALSQVYPRLAGFLARHPRLAGFINRAVRRLGRAGSPRARRSLR